MPSNKIEEYVENLTSKQIHLIINDYETLQATGAVGLKAPLRVHALTLIERLGASEDQVLLFMNQLAFECFRNLAYQWLNDRGGTWQDPD